MFLDSPTRKLVVVLNAAAITKDMPVIVDYVDITATTTTPAPGYARTSGTTPVDILVGPTAGTQRKVNGLTIYNSDTAAKTVKVYTVDNPVSTAALTGGFEYQIISLGTTDFTLVGAASNTVGVIFVPTGPGAGTGTASPVYPAIDVMLQVDDTLGYTDVNGWYALDMSGNLKTVVGTSASAIADAINTAPVKATPVGADKIGIRDSVTGLLNSVSFTNALNWFAAKAGSITQAFSTAAITVAGLLDISGAAAGQIKFPATQNPSANANTLDDYEEGTWTPTLGGTATYNTAAGTYTKIGQLVLANFVVDVLNIGTGSTTTISGLPFTVTATNRGGGGVSYVLSPATAYASINPAAIAGTTTIVFICATTAGVWTSMGSVYTSGTVISGTVMFTV